VFKRRKHEEVEIQITPMLDMAFQLLTFFILTYQPAPTEGQFSMNLLPAAPAIDMDAPQEPGEAKAAADVPAALRTLRTSIHANADGTIARIVLGENEFTQLEDLKRRLLEIRADKTLPFDQALVEADSDLSYAELMRVIDVFAGPEVNLTKLSFQELSPAGGGPL
jgi:biopolymer transport protein ExbD